MHHHEANFVMHALSSYNITMLVMPLLYNFTLCSAVYTNPWLLLCIAPVATPIAITKSII